MYKDGPGLVVAQIFNYIIQTLTVLSRARQATRLKIFDPEILIVLGQ
jgi:hypothetical protein